MNDYKVIGRMVKDAQIKETANGRKYTNILLSIPRGKDNKGNDRGADFVYITAYNKNAEKLANYSGRGLRVLIEGTVTSKRENIEFNTSVTARKVEIIDWNEQSKKRFKGE